MTNKNIIYVKTEKSDGLAAFLSFVIPGAGHMYKDRVFEGIGWFVFVLVGYAFFVFPGLILHLFCVLSAATNTKKDESEIEFVETPNGFMAKSKDIPKAEEVHSPESFCQSILKAHELLKRELLTSDEFDTTKNMELIKLLDSENKPFLNDFLTSLLPLLDIGAITKEDISFIKERYQCNRTA